MRILRGGGTKRGEKKEVLAQTSENVKLSEMLQCFVDGFVGETFESFRTTYF